MTIVSNTDVPSADPTEAREIGGDHFRSSAAYLTQTYPKRTDGADVECGISLDQLYAQRFGQDTPIPSMQLCIESVDQSGGCGYGYSCVYTDTISWASPTRPLPMIRDPRVVFDQMFGVFGTASVRRSAASAGRRISASSTGCANRRSGWSAGSAPPIACGSADYLDNVREIERRLQAVEKRNDSGEPRELPMAPRGIPDSFADHVKLMFDLQMLAFRSDITRVFSFKLGRDGSNRVYNESGSTGAFHIVSHHAENPERVRELAKINAYHVSMLPYFLKQLKETPDGDGTMLDNTRGHLRLADGQPEPAQSQARAVPHRRPRRRRDQGRRAPQGEERHPAVERDAQPAAHAGARRSSELRRQRRHVLVGMIRHALRTIGRMPGLAAVVILSLGVGIGVNTTVFSWIQAILLKPIPGVDDSGSFYHIEPKSDTGTYPGHVVDRVSRSEDRSCSRSRSWSRSGWRRSTSANPDAPSGPTRSWSPATFFSGARAAAGRGTIHHAGRS